MPFSHDPFTNFLLLPRLARVGYAFLLCYCLQHHLCPSGPAWSQVEQTKNSISSQLGFPLWGRGRGYRLDSSRSDSDSGDLSGNLALETAGSYAWESQHFCWRQLVCVFRNNCFWLFIIPRFQTGSLFLCMGQSSDGRIGSHLGGCLIKGFLQQDFGCGVR